MTDMSIGALRRRTSYHAAISTQCRVIGAIIMREIHTRFGRENIGWLWLIVEPCMLATVIALLHGGNHTKEGGIDPVAFAVVGYTNFIMFRGIVNRSAGTLEANLPLLYHKMVTVLDIVVARAILEVCGTNTAFMLVGTACVMLGYADWPARPLYIFMGVAYLFWLSTALSMLITGGTYERSLLERFVHPFTYFMIPLSGAFFQTEWLPEPYRSYILWNPFVHCFETIRYGIFETANPNYFDILYLTFCCMLLTLFGLITVRSVRNRIHLH